MERGCILYYNNRDGTGLSSSKGPLVSGPRLANCRRNCQALSLTNRLIASHHAMREREVDRRKKITTEFYCWSGGGVYSFHLTHTPLYSISGPNLITSKYCLFSLLPCWHGIFLRIWAFCWIILCEQHNVTKKDRSEIFYVCKSYCKNMSLNTINNHFSMCVLARCLLPQAWLQLLHKDISEQTT